MAAGFEEQHEHNGKIEDKPEPTLLGKIRSLFHQTNNTEEANEAGLREVGDAEVNYAHDLSDTAAMEHANEIMLDESTSKVKGKKGRVLEAMEAEARYAHDLSDTAGLEHILSKEEDNDVVDAKERDATYMHDLATYVHDLSAAAAIGALPNTHDEADIAAVEEHYNSIKDDITRIEHLIEEADRVDRAEGHSLERIFSDDDAAGLALMMMEKPVVA
eukprot:248374_1